MSDDVFWQAFKDTGDPFCWLMHKAAEKNDNNNEGLRDKPDSLGSE